MGLRIEQSTAMKNQRAVFSVFVTTCFALWILFSSGCDISSGDDTVRQVSLSIAGTYENGDGIPVRQSGDRVTRFSITQNGDQLTAIDNFGRRWTGRIGRATDVLATITLRGQTTENVEVVISGTIQVDGTSATLTGIWAEPDLNAEISATATVSGAPAPTPTPDPDNGNDNGNGGTTPTPTPTPDSGSGGGVTLLPPTP